MFKQVWKWLWRTKPHTQALPNVAENMNADAKAEAIEIAKKLSESGVQVQQVPPPPPQQK